MTDKELIAEARRLENDYGDNYEVMTHMSALADALEATEARIDRWMLLVGKCVEERMDAEAERDAALAAIERVKETLSLHNPNGRLVKEVLAALDGAPEPEEKLAEVKAQAFEEAANGVALMGTGKAVAWLRARAAEIREGESE